MFLCNNPNYTDPTANITVNLTAINIAINSTNNQSMDSVITLETCQSSSMAKCMFF